MNDTRVSRHTDVDDYVKTNTRVDCNGYCAPIRHFQELLRKNAGMRDGVSSSLYNDSCARQVVLKSESVLDPFRAEILSPARPSKRSSVSARPRARRWHVTCAFSLSRGICLVIMQMSCDRRSRSRTARNVVRGAYLLSRIVSADDDKALLCRQVNNRGANSDKWREKWNRGALANSCRSVWYWIPWGHVHQLLLNLRFTLY